jgi:hypothetical protein
MKPVDVEARVREAVWPAPPAGLRARVLASAPVASPTVSWSDRVWFSRAWRLAAVAVVLVAAAVEYVSGPTRPAAPAVSARAVAEASVIEETAQQAGLSAEQAAALARRAVAAGRPARSGIGFGGIALDDFDFGGEPR